MTSNNPENAVGSLELAGYSPINFYAEPFSWRRGFLEWMESPQDEDSGSRCSQFGTSPLFLFRFYSFLLINIL